MAKKTDPGATSLKRKLTLKQERFCQLYASEEFFANGLRSYAKAYGLDLSAKKNIGTARANSHKLLTNTDVQRRLDEIMELTGLNDQFVDRQLTKVIMQDYDLGSKVAGIREYNKLRARIIEKVDHTTKGEKINPILSRSAKDSE